MKHPALAAKMTFLGPPAKTGDLGVELEIEGDYLPMSVNGWDVHTEGSLRGRDGRSVTPGENEVDTPREYVTHGVVSINDLPSALSHLCAYLKRGKTVVRLTPRASTHIHVNMTNDTFQTYLNFICLFTIAEPILLRICGPQRNGNLFCLPSYESGDLPAYFSKLSGVMSAWPAYDHLRATWPKRGKYASLNVDPIVNFGSVEVRSFPNSVDPDEILSWANILVKLRGLARDLDTEGLQHVLDKSYHEPMWFVSQVFSLNNIFTVCAPTHPTELVYYGAEQAYELVKQVRSYLDYTPNASNTRTGMKKKTGQPFDTAYTTTMGFAQAPMPFSAEPEPWPTFNPVEDEEEEI